MPRLQGLLRELLQAVGEQQPQRSTVLGTLGSSLAGSGRHEDAAVAHLAAGDVQAAALQYQAAGEWQMALALAGALSGGFCGVRGTGGGLGRWYGTGLALFMLLKGVGGSMGRGKGGRAGGYLGALQVPGWISELLRLSGWGLDMVPCCMVLLEQM